MQYTASSYGSPILGAFRVAASRTTSPGRPAEGASDSVLSGAVLPLWSAIRVLARTIRALQHGRVTTYLQYIVWTLLLMLGFLMFAATGARP